jgi:hypothetical protein|tara:strand:+ start:750 stop:896 length:147 start_codon:yes stop_codon:yes gene_type:complete
MSEINLIILVPNSMMCGWQFYQPDKEFDYSEINVFLFFFQFQVRWGNE